MTVAIISHNHDGIRVNIDGVVHMFGNVVHLAEAYARLKLLVADQMQVLVDMGSVVAGDRQKFMVDSIQAEGLESLNALLMAIGTTRMNLT